MDIDWIFILEAVGVLGALALGLYACNWLSKYTTVQHEKKLEKRLEEREEAHRQRMIAMRTQNKSSKEEAYEDDEMTEAEVNALMAETLSRLKEEDKRTSKPKPDASRTGASPKR